MSHDAGFFGSPIYKKVMAKVYGLGGAVVLIGALWKILHLPGASLFLILGLGTEAAIFTLSAFEPPHEMPDWTLVYPELVGLEPRQQSVIVGGAGGINNDLANFGNETLPPLPSTDNAAPHAVTAGGGGGGGFAGGGGGFVGGGGGGGNVSLPNFDSEAVTKFNSTLGSFTKNIEDLSNLGDLGETTLSYVTALKNASSSVDTITDIQTQTAQNIQTASGAFTENFAKAAEQVAESGNKFSQTVTSTGSAFSDTFNSLGNSVSAEISESGSKISENLKTSGSKFAETISTVGNQFSAEISESGNTISENLKTSGSKFAETISTVGNQFNVEISDSRNKLSENLKTSGSQFAEIIGAVGKQFSSDITESGNKMASEIAISSKQLSESYAAIGLSLNQQISQVTGDIQTYSNSVTSANNSLSNLNSVYELQLKTLNSQVEESTKLTQTLGELNSIYGNMLSVMNN